MISVLRGLARSENPLALLAAAHQIQIILSGTKTSKDEMHIITNSDPEQARRDKDMQKNWHLAQYFKKPYNPTNKQLRTFFKLPGNKTEIYQQGVVAGNKMGIQCFNCKGFGHYARECRKPKRVKDYAYHKEKMMMCKQAEQVYHAKIQRSHLRIQVLLITPLKNRKDDSDVIPDSSNICTNDNQVDQNAAECVDERAALANLIANLTLDMEENKTILKQLKKANASLTQELKECKTNLDETSRALSEATSSRDSSLIALQTKQTELEKYTALNDLTSDYKILQTKLNDTLGLLAIITLNIKRIVGKTVNASTKKPKIVQLILFIVDSGCTKHMTGNLKLLCNFVEKFLGTVHFGNDQFAPILGYGDLIQGNVTIKRVYYVEGLNHNLFSVGQFCDADLEVAFRKSTCFVRDLQGNDLLTGSRGSDLYTISLQETTSSTPICFMAKASPTQAWLWHRRLSHLNFDYITLLSKKDVVTGLPKLTYVKDQLCSSCEMSKAKRSSFKTKAVPSSKGRLNLLHMDLCGPMRANYFKEEGIEHQTSTPRTPEQNGVVERRNRTLVEAARTMLSASKLPLSFWAEAVATACYTQNRSIIISTHGKTAYHIINDRKPSIKHLHIFGCICYITRDGENLDKMKEKGDPCVMVGYSTQSKGYHVYNKRTRLIAESIHIKFDEIKEMISDHNSSDLAPQRQEMSVENVSSGLVPQGQKASDYDNSDPVPPRQNVVPTAKKTDSSQQGYKKLVSLPHATLIIPMCIHFNHKVMITDGPEIIH
ncbi:retrovirus-related pol polyprotein from transposon TNT 1-94 [Tanacetum coccineum]